MPRRSLGALAALLAAVPPLIGGWAAPASAAPDPGPVLVIEGKGFGHGVGMPQDGAYAMASAGASATAILARFYPGTTIGKRSATVRVSVLQSPGGVVVVLPGGGEIRDAASGPQSAGFPVTVSPGGSVALAFDGSKYKATPLAGAAINRAAPPPTAPPTTVPPPTTIPPTTVTTGLLDPLLGALLPTTVPPTTVPAPGTPGGPVPASQTDAISGRGLWAVPKGDSVVALPGPGRSYRGILQAAGAGRGLEMIDEIDVEQYVRGMGEMPASWPAAALQAQAIAARTYAIRAAAAGRTLCDDQQCQVYIGAGNEAASTSAAATATKGQVLLYKGGLADAVYSASAGGITGTAEEGFGPGSPDLPYLKPVQYQVADPQLWATTLPVRQAGARFGYRGDVTDVRVTRNGPSGRPLEITFDGANGPMVVDAHRFWDVLQLRSTLFTLRIEAEAPPGDGSSLAIGPDDASFASPFAGDGPAPVVAATARAVAAESLGRAPWVGLAVLLLAAWGNAAHRHTARMPAPAETEPAESKPAEPPDG